MIKPEAAQEQLEELHNRDWLDANLGGLKKLPTTVRSIGHALLGRQTDGSKIGDWQEQQKARTRAIATLDAQSVDQRRALFGVLFPKLEAEVEAAWQLNASLPYQATYYDRKGFRAPRHRQYTYARTSIWFQALSEGVSGFEQDIIWWAAWAGHADSYDGGNGIGLVFAAAMNTGGKIGDEVFDVLCASARNEHDIGRMGRHVSRALLTSNREDGWELMEKMLLAAQRQEGLRQTILETVDEAHPEAFRRILRVILDNDLARFSAVARAVDVWFGFQWDSASTKVVNDVIEQTLKFLEDDDARKKALANGDGDDLYLALWTLATEDAVLAIDIAKPILADKNVKRRFIAAHLLTQLGLPPGQDALLASLDDEDLRVAWHASTGFSESTFEEEIEGAHPKDLFERLEKLIARIPGKGMDLKALVWPWMRCKAEAASLIGILMDNLGDRPPTRLLPYLSRMDSFSKEMVVEKLGKQKKWDVPTRETLFALVGDASSGVRESAVRALENCKIEQSEAEQLEGRLTRKAGDLRRGVLRLLLKQGDDDAFASADRLLTSTDGLQRLAGLEMLRELAVAKRQRPRCLERAERFKEERPRRNKEEERSLVAIAESVEDRPTLDNALGLLDPAERTPVTQPVKRLDPTITPAAAALIASLDDVIHAHAETSIVVKQRPREIDEDDDFEDDDYYEPEDDGKPKLLGVMAWDFPLPSANLSREEDIAYLPLADVWQAWWTSRPSKTRDKDGMELFRALALLAKLRDEEYWDELPPNLTRALPSLFGSAKLKEPRYFEITQSLLLWMMRLHAPSGSAKFLLDVIETTFALVPKELLSAVADPEADDDVYDWRTSYDTPFEIWEKVLSYHRDYCRKDWHLPEHAMRLYQLYNWRDLSVPGIGRARPDFDYVVQAYKAGGATRADLLDMILGPLDADDYSGSHLSDLTERKSRVGWVKELPELQELADTCRHRILEIELARGETPTAASAPACALRSICGIDTLVRILTALGKDRFHRGYSYSENLGRACVLTNLAEVCYPRPSPLSPGGRGVGAKGDEDSPAQFAQKMRAAEIPDERLIELAFKAPQWVKHVEHTLGWENFSEGVWWFLAHTRDSGQEFDKAWKALLSERTSLTWHELSEGAVDVAWFHRAHEAVGPKRWLSLDEAAKFASMGGGYRRAQFLASVLLGKAKRNDLLRDVKTKRLKESVRALGLLPLATGAARDKDLHERYHALQEYHRYARGLSALSREGAVNAANVGIANLARTAGYPDAVRFQWSMEAAGCADLVKGVTARSGPVEASLQVDAEGQIQWTILSKGKQVKSIPPAQRKDKKLCELAERKKELARSQSRMRRGLEDMMCRADTFTGAELGQLMVHPLLAPMLARLVLIGEGILGYPEKKGQALRDFAGKLEPVKKSETLRLAHSHDLLDTGKWDRWQHDAFAREVVQPFKQIFRELYVVTAMEKKAGPLSHRYAGHQVQPRQATALWGARGWGVSEDGIRKTFHDAGITAWVTLQYTYGTAAEVEGWTLESVGFTRVKDQRTLKVTEIPPLIFSEVMRDMDLVVSVAHRGGVDPEASASTVEMRGNLLRELCSLLKLKNVRQKDSHILIDGTFAKYSVHLGSGGVHRLPGGAMCIIPVHAQHRGRLFLPFADDDPKTAEILSKVLLLSRDNEIQDPSILDQLK